MMVVAVAAVLGSIAMATYSDYVIKANRTDARAALSQLSTSLEKCRSLHSDYNSANCNVKFTSTVYSADGLYTISAPTLTASTFTLTATPVTGKSQAGDADCKTLSVTNTGEESATGADPGVCW